MAVPPVEAAGSRWLRAVWQYGFPLVFAIVAVVYGLYFGNELLKTQRDGITAITRIETMQEQYTRDLAALRLQVQQLHDQLTIVQQQTLP